ncbi:MAG: hypothetical protein NUV31_11815, partial [Dehalococcoidales bacterium]|nr:hypothetical protein [Dehalococcoidales bacterium]
NCHKTTAIINALKNIENEWWDDFRNEYPEFDETEQKKFIDYWSSAKKELKQPKLALRNWMIKYKEFKEKNGINQRYTKSTLYQKDRTAILKAGWEDSSGI